MADHNQRGNESEEIASRHLISKGYVILQRNWKAGKLELDIVARKDSTLIIVEVKSRKEDDIVDPLDAVDDKKIRRIILATDSYIRQNDWNGDVRFDLISVIRPIEGETLIEHIEDAFYPPIMNKGR